MAAESDLTPKYGARVYALSAGKALVKQTVKKGSESAKAYVIDAHRERHVDLADDKDVAEAIRSALSGELNS